MQKQKMSEETKIKLIYCGELVLIAAVVIVIGALKLAGIIATKPTRLFIYNIITMAGGTWLIFDLIWALVSKKRRPKVCLLDKILVLPVGLYLFYFDIVCFINKAQGTVVDDLLVKLSVGIVLLYVGVVYLFQAVYHYKYPLPQIIEAIEEAKKAKEEEQENSQNQVEEVDKKEENEDEKA